MRLYLIILILTAAAFHLLFVENGELRDFDADEMPEVATFSVVGYDPETGDLGVAVQSKFFGVGSVVPWAKAGVGAIATQALANTTYGPKGLKLLEEGLSPEEVIEKLLGKDPGRDFRQVGIVDSKGRSAAFTGEKAQNWKGHVKGENFSCQGNILAGEEVVKRMSHAFRFTEGDLADRLLAALKGAQSAGGDKRGRQSAAILVARKNGGYAGWNDRYIDLRIEDHTEPIKELERLLDLHRSYFRNVPVPEEEVGFPAPGGEGSPGAVFREWKQKLVNGEFEELYELYSEKFRKKMTLEQFIDANENSHEANIRALAVITFVKARVDGDKAFVYYRHVGTNRPNIMKMIKEQGKWRIDR